MICKDKKGLRDKNYMTANYTPILWSILINMLEEMNEYHQSAQVNEEFICVQKCTF